ncbi:hypothetical protein HK104_001846 [Borealophlyctis nickersoniae]|nr:hypothetical protein HK104_001846 [Borealophlyctis nickersoniae]
MERSLMRISRDLDTMFINEIDLSLGGRAMERDEHEKIYYGSPHSDTQAVDRIKNLYAAVPARMTMKKPYAGIFDMDESSKAALRAWLGILSRFQSNAADFLNRSAACKQSSEPVKCLRPELEKLKEGIQAIESVL